MHIAGQRDSIRTLLRDISDAIGSGNSQANNNAVLIIALMSLLVAILAIFTPLMMKR